jgi:hypothetical protein
MVCRSGKSEIGTLYHTCDTWRQHAAGTVGGKGCLDLHCKGTEEHLKRACGSGGQHSWLVSCRVFALAARVA